MTTYRHLQAKLNKKLEEMLGGVNKGGKWEKAEIRLIGLSRLVGLWSLWILSEKNLGKDLKRGLESQKMVKQAKKSDEEEIYHKSWRGRVGYEVWCQNIGITVGISSWSCIQAEI